MPLAWEWSADGRSCRKDDPLDYPIAGERTHGVLIIRGGGFFITWDNKLPLLTTPSPERAPWALIIRRGLEAWWKHTFLMSRASIVYSELRDMRTKRCLFHSIAEANTIGICTQKVKWHDCMDSIESLDFSTVSRD